MKSKKSRLVGVVTVAAVGAYLAVLNWFAEPKPSAAETATPPPKYSIVFVVDSSNTMFPPYGPNYFDLAIEGIAELLAPDGIPREGLMDYWEGYEFAVIQFADLDLPPGANTPGYYEDTHWLDPRHIANLDQSQQLYDLTEDVLRLEPTKHFTASLMEVGIREATALLIIGGGHTAADNSTQRHIILLTTGEYRLPPPCPPEGYTGIPLPDPNVYNCEYPSVSLADFCACRQASCLGADAFCNRACHIRYFAEEARANGIRLSTIRLGPEWGYTVNGVNCEEPDYPYGEDLDYCPMDEDGSAFDPSALPPVPDRDGLLKELSNWGHVIGGKREPCDTDQPLGKNARINPFYGFGTGEAGFKPGTSEQIADRLVGWLCDWAVEGLTEPELQSHPQNRDEDYYDPERTQPILSLCDNCPDTYNPHQRDCNRNGIGDVCEHPWPEGFDGWYECGPGTEDSDCDQVLDAYDICPGGDDCLVRKWLDEEGCGDLDNATDCGCDCDRDGLSDVCQAAIDVAEDTLPSGPNPTYDMWDDLDPDFNGLADHCNSALNCSPIPDLCNIEKNDGYEETFTDPDTGLAKTFSDLEGWSMSDPRASDAVQIATDADATFLQIAFSQTVYQNGNASWSIEGPAFVLPAPHVAQVNDSCEIARWGIYAFELRFRIKNQSDNSTYDIYLLDTCEALPDSAVRFHVRFSDEPFPKGVWTEANPACTKTTVGDPPMQRVAAYNTQPPYNDENSWRSLVIIFNLAASYLYNSTDDACEWSPDESIIKSYPGAGLLGGGSSCRDWAEVGVLEAERARGIQFVITTDNSYGEFPGSALEIERIAVTRSSWCDWTCNGHAEGCASLDNWRACGCPSGGWKCPCEDPDDPNVCGNGRIDGDEECDPPNKLHCGCDCKWMCGDGYTQGPDSVSGPGLGTIPVDFVEGEPQVYRDEVCRFFGVNPGCVAGEETCDPPGTETLWPCGQIECSDASDPDGACHISSYRAPDNCCRADGCNCYDCVEEPVCEDGCLCREHAPPPYGNCDDGVNTETGEACDPCEDDGYLRDAGTPCEQCEVGEAGCGNDCLRSSSSPGG